MRRIGLIAAALLLAASSLASAQDPGHCTESDTPAECKRRFLPESDAADIAPGVAPVAEETAATSSEAGASTVEASELFSFLADVETAQRRNSLASTDAARRSVRRELASKSGESSMSTSSGAASKKDFNSLFQALYQSGALGDGEERDGGVLAFQLNNFLGLTADDGYRLELLRRKATLFPTLKEMLAEDTRDARTTELEKGLNDFADLSLCFTYSPVTETLGRGKAPYQEIRDGLDPKRLEARAQAFVSLIPARMRTSFLAGDQAFSTLTGRAKQAADEYTSMLRAATDVVELSHTELDLFDALIDNQPQLSVTVEQAYRDVLAGPDELKVRLSYEVSRANVNRLRKSAECSGTLTTGCVQRYFAADGRREKAAERGSRFTFNGSFAQIDPYQIELADDNVSLDLERDRQWSVEATYSQYLSFKKLGKDRTRLEANATWENVGDAPDREDRYLLQVGISQVVPKLGTFSVGLRYASEPEFLGDVDQEISARFGLSYKLLRPEGEEEEEEEGDGG